MYAVIQTGSKQYKIEENSILEVELLDNDKKVELKEVLLCNDGKKTLIGNPYVSNCKIEAEIIKETKGDKVIAYKYKRRKNYRRKVGHRQKYSQVKITKIALT
jgi:large subunit ribosomal protein L21